VNIFSERELAFTFAICCRPSVCRLSITLVHPTQVVVIFGNISTASADVHDKFYGDRPRGTPPSVELNTTGVTKYSDFRSIESCISETVQDGR